MEARGYKDTGAEGELRAAVHDIEGMIAGRNLDEVTIAMLQMRRTEKDYLLRGDEKYVSQIGDNVATLKQAISAAPSEQLTSAEKSEATGFADEYQAAFTSLVAANQAVAEATRRLQGRHARSGRHLREPRHERARGQQSIHRRPK